MIRIQRVSKNFGKLKALDDVSVFCESGNTIALIGPNGCGKTTLIKCILGMVVPDSGTILINEKPILNEWRYRTHFGFMPQMGRYPDNMSIGQVIGMMKDIRKAGTEVLDEELIVQFQLDSIFHKRMSTLSGGTRQKVSASLAFLFDPAVLILDEPTAGLDPLSSEILKEKILKEKKKGKLILITSHVLSELDDLVMQIIYMQDGGVRFHKNIDNLRADTGEEKLSRAVARFMLEQQRL